eukprot:TRINITY_DN41738_c0_g1_i1.p1 TRINITY_DN41738_c0_g1~~TRINITY_DN41738_c0_g1_i1.p1  ORF type:complete len:158 (-),score=30.03 TRINITY_DN41738_c0_g1_i1:357-830(-)
MFLAANVTHISETDMMAPRAQASDGKIDLVWIQQVGRCELIGLFGDVEDGAHVDSECMVYKQVSWFRVVPEECEDGCCCCCSLFCCCCCPPVTEQTGYMVVDGEQVPYGPIEGAMLPGRLNLFQISLPLEQPSTQTASEGPGRVLLDSETVSMVTKK